MIQLNINATLKVCVFKKKKLRVVMKNITKACIFKCG